MRKSQAEKVLNREVTSFGRRMSILTFEEMLATSQFKEAHKQFVDYIAKAKGHANPELRNFVLKKAIMFSGAVGTDVTHRTVIHFPLGGKSIKLREKEHALIENLNRQYCWLLVSAYESYESFLKELYACMGFLDTALWQCNDYGSVSPSQVNKLRLQWFKDRVRDRANPKFREGVSYVLQRFRNTFHSIASYEKTTLSSGRMSLYSDGLLHHSVDTLPLAMTCHLAEKLRHAIVHNQGSINSIQSLCASIGVNGMKKSAIVSSYTRASTEVAYIWLVYDEKGMLDYRFLSLRISHLFESLCAHACLLYKSCLGHFGKSPYWDRQNKKPKVE